MSTFALNTKNDRTFIEKYLVKVLSWEKGQNPWVTVENTGGDIKSKPFVKIRANQLWGDPRAHWLDKKTKKDEE
jgi:hypothetical protein